MQSKKASSSKQTGNGAGAMHKGGTRFFSHSTQLFRHHVPTEFVLLGLIEFVALFFCFYIGLELWTSETNFIERLDLHWQRAIAFAFIMQISLIAFGVYERQSSQSSNMLAVRIGGSLLLGSVILGLVYYVAPAVLTGRGALALAVFVSFVALMAIRLVFGRISSAYDLRLRVLVLGAGAAANLIREVEASRDIAGINIVSFMPMPGDREENKGIGLVQTPGALVKFVGSNNVDVIVLAMDERRKGLPVHELLDCKMGGIEVIDLLTFFERYTNKIRLDIMQPSWLFLSEGFRVSSFRRIWKRTLDIITVLLLAPFVLPLMLLSALFIFLESRCRGAIFYSQTRVGENGKLFQIYKFRSMVSNAEDDGVARWGAKNDSRITLVGTGLRKFRLDELPQLYNVLRGDMSFVGPRPERPEFVERLSRKIPYYNERHRVKPGLTGWAQIKYPYGASEEDGREKLQFDLYYVKNYSILLDALVLLQTAEVVLLGKGAQ